ncbi:uncharacterized protein BDZ99DRAFT_6526 [Mytilinidion resinicola]|uniref:Uncharacterized protein n=1 Tax=Mytilinidion resinicola TaxID=574789 RepID=A0A6A6Z8E5_9PEZI|nr:uncharacterized protein BDZ99DRAFT_6526 [Mytilinidion resinicola]KAF2816989.1 hypothetical protein BDZ99DRAFT_6526 [Mytilinidion resinicola]
MSGDGARCLLRGATANSFSLQSITDCRHLGVSSKHHPSERIPIAQSINIATTLAAAKVILSQTIAEESLLFTFFLAPSPKYNHHVFPIPLFPTSHRPPTVPPIPRHLTTIAGRFFRHKMDLTLHRQRHSRQSRPCPTRARKEKLLQLYVQPFKTTIWARRLKRFFFPRLSQNRPNISGDEGWEGVDNRVVRARFVLFWWHDRKGWKEGDESDGFWIPLAIGVLAWVVGRN